MEIRVVQINRLLLIILAFSFLGWTWTADFESGTLGNDATGTSGFSAISGDVTFDNTYANTGSQSAKFVMTAGSNGETGEINHTDVSSIDGTEGWGEMYVYFGSASDNASGLDWDWNQNDTGQADVTKFFRFNKFDGASSAGYSSIFVRTQNDSYEGYAQGENESPSHNFYQSSVRFDEVSKWYRVNFYVLWGDNSDGAMKIWIDDTLVVDQSGVTLLDGATRAWKRSLVWSFWNGGLAQNQTCWVDDITVTNEDPNWSFVEEEPSSSNLTMRTLTLNGATLTL